MKYYVIAIQNCEPKTYSFKTKKRVDNFLQAFTKKYGSLDDKDGNWIDHIFYGKKYKLKETL